MFHAGAADLHGVGHIARIARVGRQRQVLQVRLFGHRAHQQKVQPVVEHAIAPARFENRLDAVHPFGLEFANLLAGLLGRLGSAQQLRLHSVLNRGRQVLYELGAVSALGGEHGSADEKLRAELGAVGDGFPQLEGSVQAVAYAARRGDSAIEQGGGGARHGLFDIVILGICGDAAGSREMDVRIDQAGQQRLARALHHLGFQLFGVRRRAFVDGGDLAVANQYGPVFDHLAIAREDARVADQEDAGALQIAVKRGIISQMVLAVGFPRAHQDEWREHRDHPELVARPDLFFLLPAEELHGEEQSQHRREQQGGHRRRIVPQILIAEEDSLEAADQV